MTKKPTVLMAGIVLQIGAREIASARRPIDDFPMEDRAAEALKPVMAKARAGGRQVGAEAMLSDSKCTSKYQMNNDGNHYELAH